MRVVRTVLALATLVGLGACGDDTTAAESARSASYVLLFDGRGAPVTGDARVIAATSYWSTTRTAWVPIAEREVRAPARLDERVTVPVDLGACLSEPAPPPQFGVPPSAVRRCSVRLALRFVVGGRVVDQLVYDDALTPRGANAVVPLVRFSRALTVRLLQRDTSLVWRPVLSEGVALLRNGVTELRAVVLDSASGDTLTRAVEWSSTAPRVDFTAFTQTDVRVQVGSLLGTFRVRAEIASGVADVPFTVRPRTVVASLDVQAPGGGTIVASTGERCTVPLRAASPTRCTLRYPENAPPVLTAVPDSASEFDTFTGSCTLTAPTTCTLGTDLFSTAVVARFTPRLANASVEVTSAGRGAGRIVASNGQLCDFPLGTTRKDCAFTRPWNAPLRLEAIPAAGSRWEGYEICITRPGTACDITPGTEPAMRGRFNLDSSEVRFASFTGLSAGDGRVTTTDGRIDCVYVNGVASGACRAMYRSQDTLTYSAVPAQGSIFGGWPSSCAGVAPPTLFNNCPTIGSTAGLGFTRIPGFTAVRELTVVLTGSGGGRVGVELGECVRSAGSPEDRTCRFTLPRGRVLFLTPQAFAGSVVGPMTGCTELTPQPVCRVVMDVPRTVTFTFTRP
ncbi:MAG: hypothetical protein MUF21_10980 [Gemmatimonadaceae bacterium]|nr:hypothetical protein [Gemmatimonadaceae bacterium]